MKKACFATRADVRLSEWSLQHDNLFFRFHPACIDMTVEEAKRLDHFFCESCSAEGQKKLQNSHSASRLSDTKVFQITVFDNVSCFVFTFQNFIPLNRLTETLEKLISSSIIYWFSKFYSIVE